MHKKEEEEGEAIEKGKKMKEQEKKKKVQTRKKSFRSRDFVVPFLSPGPKTYLGRILERQLPISKNLQLSWPSWQS